MSMHICYLGSQLNQQNDYCENVTGSVTDFTNLFCLFNSYIINPHYEFQTPFMA